VKWFIIEVNYLKSARREEMWPFVRFIDVWGNWPYGKLNMT
jgi:hypothetical protein